MVSLLVSKQDQSCLSVITGLISEALILDVVRQTELGAENKRFAKVFNVFLCNKILGFVYSSLKILK